MDASVLTPSDVIYYLAVSADGYLATPDGGVDWLDPYFVPELGFHDFIARIGTVVMGRATWDKVESFGKWPYGEIPGIVATHRPLDAKGAPVTARAGTPPELLAAARETGPGALLAGRRRRSRLRLSRCRPSDPHRPVHHSGAAGGRIAGLSQSKPHRT